MRRVVLTTAVVLAALWVAVPARAAEPVIRYAAGWNMVGGPAGTDFFSAQAVYGYGNGAYATSPTRVQDACRGAWASFVVPTDITLASAATTTTQTCTLQSGWTMVGNPLNAPALLPSGESGYHWNPSSNGYDIVTRIPTGASIWMYSNTARVITLQAVPAIEVTVTVPPGATDPIQLHPGDYFTLRVFASGTGPDWIATADPAYLRAIDSGLLPGSSTYYYRWQVLATGDTIITLDPFCLKNGCRIPSYAVRLQIVP